MAWQKVRIDIPKDYKPAIREAIAQDVIQYIVERTKRGVGKNDRPWSGKAAVYSKSYIKGLDFRNAGKRNSPVDLTLSADMLTDLQLLSHNKGSVLIGYNNGSENNAKAEGNIKGTYGNKKPIPGKSRDFLGITKKSLNKILGNYPLDIKELEEIAARKEMIEGLVGSIFKGITVGE